MERTFTSLYTGFCGQTIIGWAEIPPTVCWRLGSPGTPLAGKSGAIQWFHPTRGIAESLPQTLNGQVFLAGRVWQNKSTQLEQCIATSLHTGRYGELAHLAENSAGCFLRNDGVMFFWVGFASEDVVFLRKLGGSQIRWSTHPLDLIVSQEDLDMRALWGCCHGENNFVYKGIIRVEQGHLLRINPDGQQFLHEFDRFQPDSRFLSKTLTIEMMAQGTHEAILNAVRPYAFENLGEPVGIMYSGGAGCSALLEAMKEVGAQVIAYNMEATDPAGSEYYYAQLACSTLDIPLVRIPMSSGVDYLSLQWMFSHPDGHCWVRWFEQLAEQAQRNGVYHLMTGAGDDSSFGPAMQYSVYAILSAPIPMREKWLMLKGMAATDWNIMDILKSVRPSRDVIGPCSNEGPVRGDRVMKTAQFLRPVFSCQKSGEETILHNAIEFSPQSLSIEQTILQPRGIRLCYPFHDRQVQAVSLALPAAYRLIPNLENLVPALVGLEPPLERKVNKAILRLSYRHTGVPPEVIWRTWAVCTQAPVQAFCVNHPEMLKALLGPGSCLDAMGWMDVERLEQILSRRSTIRENYTTLIASSMVELFLKGAWQEQCRRGGPVWG